MSSYGQPSVPPIGPPPAPPYSPPPGPPYGPPPLYGAPLMQHPPRSKAGIAGRIAALLFLPPLGSAWAWSSTRLSRAQRALIVAGCCLWTLILIGSSGDNHDTAGTTPAGSVSSASASAAPSSTPSPAASSSPEPSPSPSSASPSPSSSVSVAESPAAAPAAVATAQVGESTPATSPAGAPATTPPAHETVPPQPPAPEPTHTSDGGGGSAQQGVHYGAFCAPQGAVGVSDTGGAAVCKPAKDGRNRWQKP